MKKTFFFIQLKGANSFMGAKRRRNETVAFLAALTLCISGCPDLTESNDLKTSSALNSTALKTSKRQQLNKKNTPSHFTWWFPAFCRV